MKFIVTVLIIAPILAFAGKAEREFMNSEVNPALKAAENSFKKNCGCKLSITVSDSLKSRSELELAKYVAETVASGSEKHCTDKPSKDAVCKMKTLEVTKAGETKFSFSGSRGIASTDGQVVPTFEMMTDQLDK